MSQLKGIFKVTLLDQEVILHLYMEVSPSSTHNNEEGVRIRHTNPAIF